MMFGRFPSHYLCYVRLLAFIDQLPARPDSISTFSVRFIGINTWEAEFIG